MTMDQLTDFYALTAKSDSEAQKQADCFLVQAINLSLEGDAIMAGEMLLEAHRIITERLESEKLHKRTTQEMKQHSDDLSVFSCNVGNGGLFL